jgi:hypothetical protein
MPLNIFSLVEWYCYFNVFVLISGVDLPSLYLGCPRNKKKFRFKPKQSDFFGLFLFVSLFRTGIETTETNRILSIKTEKKEKISKKCSLLGVLETVNFFLCSNRNKPKLNLFRLFFSLVFRETKFFFSVCFGLFRCLGPVSKQPKQTELMVWGIKRLIF